MYGFNLGMIVVSQLDLPSLDDRIQGSRENPSSLEWVRVTCPLSSGWMGYPNEIDEPRLYRECFFVTLQSIKSLIPQGPVREGIFVPTDTSIFLIL